MSLAESIFIPNYGYVLLRKRSHLKSKSPEKGKLREEQGANDLNGCWFKCLKTANPRPKRIQNQKITLDMLGPKATEELEYDSHKGRVLNAGDIVSSPPLLSLDREADANARLEDRES